MQLYLFMYLTELMDSTKNHDQLGSVVRMSNDAIGRGSYGVVHKGYTSDKAECAIKMYHPILAEEDPGLVNEMVLHEAYVMNKLSNHSNLVQFMGLYYPPSNKDGDYPDYPYIVMELCHKGNLESCLKDNTLNLQIKLKILHDIAKGLEHMHSHGFIHCDLSPNNILLTETFEAKIGDFGVTKLFKGKNLTDLAPGRLGYMGPEAKRSVSSYNEKLDIYSFGCVVLFTITGIECTDNIEEWLNHISPWPLLQELAKQCLQDDPQKRPTAGEICEQLCSMQTSIIDFDKDDSTSLKKVHLKVVQEDHLFESLLQAQYFNDTSNKIMRPYILEEDDMSSEGSEPDKYEEDELSTSSTLQVSCHKKQEKHDKGNAVDNDRRLSFGNGMVKSNTRLNGFIASLLFMFCLQSYFLHIESFSANGLNNSNCISPMVALYANNLPVVAQNNTHAKSDLYVISNPQYEVQYYNTKKTLLYNSAICENNSFPNYSTRLSDKGKSMEHLHLERCPTLTLFAYCLRYPFLCTHHMHQCANTSEDYLFYQLNAKDPSVVVQQNDASSSMLQFPFMPIMPFISDEHLLLKSCTVNVDEGKGFPFKKPVENVQLVALHTEPPLVTLPATLPDHCFMHNRTLFTGDGRADMLIKTELLTASSVTGTSELKITPCFAKVMADGCTVQSLQNNDTCYHISYGELEKYFHTLLDPIFSNLTSIVGLPSIDKLLPLHINNNAVVNTANVKSKFKSMTFNDHDDNDTEFALTSSYCSLLLLIMLLSFLYCLFLLSFFVRQLVRCQMWYIIRLSSRVACIGNNNIFRPSSQFTLVEMPNTNTTTAVIQRRPYYFRRRYSQYAIPYNKLLTSFVFQAPPLCFNEAFNFQTLCIWFVNMTTCNLNCYIHYQGNVPIMLLNSDVDQFHIMMSLSIRREQTLVLILWQQFPSGFHKTSALILCKVEYNKSQFNIVSLKWMNNEFLRKCNDAITLQSFKFSNMQLHGPAFLTCKMQVIKVRNPVRHYNWNTAIVNNKQIQSNIWLMICRWFKYVREDETIDAIVTSYKLVCDLNQHALCQQKDDSMFRSSSNNCNDMHLTEIQFRILINQLEIHLIFADAYRFLREFMHEDLSRSIVAVNFLSALQHKVTAGHTTHHYILQLLRMLHCTIAYCQTSLLDSPDDRAGVFDGSCIQLVTNHITHNICIHQPAQRKSELDSVPGHGGDALIKGNHVLRFQSVNPPLRHPAILPLPQTDICNHDMKVGLYVD